MQYRIMLNRDEGWSMTQAHRHDCLELLLCLQNGGNFFLRDTVHTLRQGTLVIMQEAVLHRSIATESTYERYVLHIPRDTLATASGKQTDFAAIIRGNFCIQLAPDDFAQLRMLMEECYTSSDALGSDVLRDCAFLRILVKVAQLLPSGEVASVSGLSHPVRQAIDWINSHLAEDLSLNTLASHCYATKYHLCRLFKEETGFTVGEYILQQRLSRACALLQAGESVQKAGEDAGFQNYNHFIRTFHHWMGISPGRYRRQISSYPSASPSH